MAKGVLGLGGWLLPHLTAAVEAPSTFGASYKTIYGRLASERDLYRFLAEKEKCKAQDLMLKKTVMMLREKKEAERSILGEIANYKAVMREYANERERLDTAKIDERLDKVL
jgi:queuine/archaeosine tRNA-ribosyltransferase